MSLFRVSFGLFVETNYIYIDLFGGFVHRFSVAKGITMML